MSKIQVTASKDFFDRGNNIQRKKGDQFTLKAGYAGTLERVGYVKLDAEGKKAVKDAADEVHASVETAKAENVVSGAKDMTTATHVTSGKTKAPAKTAAKTATPKKVAAKKTSSKKGK